MPDQWEQSADAYSRSFARLCAGTVGHLLDAVDSPVRGATLKAGRDRMRAAYTELTEKNCPEDMLVLPSTALLASGRRPE